MLADLASVQGLLKIAPIKIDNNICRCHYKLTVLFLVISTILVSLKQYVGDPIDCIINSGKSPIPTDTLDKYCWIHSTHTLPNGPGTEGSMPIPGLGTPKEDDQLVYHKYYQWVAFFLLFQAITFYLPHFTWKFWEAGRMKALLEDLHFSVVQTDVQKKAKHVLVEYLFTNVHQHQIYATAFFVCELLNAINVIAQIFMVDTFLGGEFTEYGANVMSQYALDPEDRTDPMSYVSELSISYIVTNATEVICSLFSGISQINKVLVHDVWSIRHYPEIRRPVYFTNQHSERKNFHLSLVLVHHLGHFDWHSLPR